MQLSDLDRHAAGIDAIFPAKSGVYFGIEDRF
jgi:hypothetical protein